MCAAVSESRFAVGSSARTSFGSRDHRARDGDALALAAGELVGPLLRLIRESDLRRASGGRARRARGAARR